jgi:DNA-binding HxlR family transcriptional regulator
MAKAGAKLGNAAISAPLARDEGRKYNHPCLIAQSLDVLGDRWTLLILRDLMSGLHRFNDILQNCAGMSPNVLSARLKHLEERGLVLRTYYRERPPRVDYSLTEQGWAVRPILLAMIEWGRQYLEPIDDTSVGTDVSADFVVRVVSAFSFHPERAAGLEATMVIEIADCADCNTWAYEIRDGRLYPRRRPSGDADVRLKTDTQGFFKFLRGELPAEACGELDGPPETAAAIQACFLAA